MLYNFDEKDNRFLLQTEKETSRQETSRTDENKEAKDHFVLMNHEILKTNNKINIRN